MEQIVAHLNGLPLRIVYLSNGHIAIAKAANSFPTIFDQPEEGMNAVISTEELVVGSTRILYNTAIDYKQLPDVLQWLIQQKLESPI